MENYAKTLPDIHKAFLPQDRVLRCIDERTPGGIHLAGSGILMKDDQLRKTLIEADIKSVWTHAECGAAKLYAEQNGFDPGKADDYARAFGENLEKNFGIKYNGHLSVEPSGLHTARVAYYDTTGSFDFQNIPELPHGFVINRKYIDPRYAAMEMQVAFQIATGSHGFGNLITPETPFLMVAISDNYNQSLSLEILKTELEAIKNNNPLILTDGFTTPHIALSEAQFTTQIYQ